MGYNYFAAFLPIKTVCPECLKEIALTALMLFRSQHPDADGVIEFKLHLETSTVEVLGYGVFYTFKELGFNDVC